MKFNQTLKWLFIYFVFLVSGCQKPVQSPEQFVEEVLRTVASGNEKVLFDEYYLNSKSEIKKLALEIGGESMATEEIINEIYGAIMEDQHRIIDHYRFLGIQDFNTVKIDSIIEKKETNRSFDPKHKVSKGYRLSIIKVYLTNNERKYTVKLACADLNTGRWKILEHPRIDEKE